MYLNEHEYKGHYLYALLSGQMNQTALAPDFFTAASLIIKCPFIKADTIQGCHPEQT